jgi:hypothetical protein
MAKNPESVTAETFMNPQVLSMAMVNSRAWRGAEIPAANGHTNGRALARLFGALARSGEVDGFRVMAAREIPKCHVRSRAAPTKC